MGINDDISDTLKFAESIRAKFRKFYRRRPNWDKIVDDTVLTYSDDGIPTYMSINTYFHSKIK